MGGALTFVLNGELVDASNVSPNTTLLNFLRRNKRLTGTKEGCAEGDCGACTVAVGERTGDTIQYQAINACIQFLPMLHGKSVVTVEGLAGSGNALHPAQQAIVDCHGSQCGFCTPGFVMSLYAMGFYELSPSKQRINDGLAGNLCRCTGYGPLIAAAETAGRSERPSWDLERIAREMSLLGDVHRCHEVANSGQKSYLPNTIDELADVYLANPDAVIIAGATDVGLWVTKQMRDLPVSIHIGQITELRNVRISENKLWIGAAATYSDAEQVIANAFPDFGELVRRIGAVQVRNSGTIGGNIANGSPIGDTPPALMALDAAVILRKGSARRRLPIREFFIAYGEQDRAPGEFIEAIEVPLLEAPEQLRCYKISKRFDQDISALCGCFNIKVEAGVVKQARIAFGGMAGTPLRASAVEAVLLGEPWSDATIEKSMPAFEIDFTPLSDMRGSAEYRMLTAKNLLRKYFSESHGSQAQTRLVGRGAVNA